MRPLIALIYILLSCFAFADITPRKNGDFFEASFSVQVALVKAETKWIHLPLPINQPMPQYPLEMRESAIQGEVLVQFALDKDGSVKSWKVLQEAIPGFSEAAKSVVKDWRFGAAEDYQGNRRSIVLNYAFIFLLPDLNKTNPRTEK
ncbi:MAG: TonB family protein [Undibacterium sp.]|nr:TonB family protein [Opitutaceae bacterium]